jgi:hypothetical protein
MCRVNGNKTITTIHAMETFNGLPIVNSVGTAHVSIDGYIVDATHTFVPNHKVRRALDSSLHKRDALITPQEAVVKFASLLHVPNAQEGLTVVEVQQHPKVSQEYVYIISCPNLSADNVTVSPKYYHHEERIVKVWEFDVPSRFDWYNAHVDMHSGEVIAVSSWKSPNIMPDDVLETFGHSAASSSSESQLSKRSLAGVAATSALTLLTGAIASATINHDLITVKHLKRVEVDMKHPNIPDAEYRVVPFEKDGIDDGLIDIKNPWDLETSPYGWHFFGKKNGFVDSTVGNNVIARSNPKELKEPPLPRYDNDFKFLYTANLTKDPLETMANTNAALVNSYVSANLAHDL